MSEENVSQPEFVEEKPIDGVANVAKEIIEEIVEKVVDASGNTASLLDVSANLVETVKSALVLLIENIILEHTKEVDPSKKLTFKLEKKSSDILMRILNRFPESLDEIKITLSDIIKDGKIDSNDLPNLIKLVEKFYELIGKSGYSKFGAIERTEISASLLKSIIHILVAEKNIEIPEEMTPLALAQFDKLIDSCVGLVSFALSKPKSCCIIA